MHSSLVILIVIVGVAIAEPIPKMASFNDIDFSLSESGENQESRMMVSKTASLVLDLINAVVGYKVSAISLAVGVIDWIVTNSIVIIIGGFLALGFCKITGKCSLDYSDYVPQMRSLVTSEQLDMAEKFLTTAIEKYAEEKRSAL